MQENPRALFKPPPQLSDRVTRPRVPRIHEPPPLRVLDGYRPRVGAVRRRRHAHRLAAEPPERRAHRRVRARRGAVHEAEVEGRVRVRRRLSQPHAERVGAHHGEGGGGIGRRGSRTELEESDETEVVVWWWWWWGGWVWGGCGVGVG